MASYQRQWPLFIKALNVYKEVIQYELIFGDDRQYRGFALDFPKATTSHAMASWLLFDVPHDQRPLAEILLASQPLPQVTNMDTKLFRQFLKESIQSYESVYEVIEANDLSVKVNDLLLSRHRIIYWPLATNYFVPGDLMVLRAIYPIGSPQGFALTPPRPLGRSFATRLIRLFKDFSQTSHQWQLVSSKDLIKLCTPEMWLATGFQTADEKLIAPFTPLSTKRVEAYMEEVRTFTEDRDFSIAIDRLAQGLLGDFMEMLEADEIVDYTEHLYLLHDLFHFLGGLEMADLLPAKPALLEKYFRTVAERGMTFHTEHFLSFFHWVSALFQFALVENEGLLPYVEEMNRLKSDIFLLLSLINTETGLVFDEEMTSFVTGEDDSPIILGHVWNILQLAGQQRLELTPTGRLKKNTREDLDALLQSPYFSHLSNELYGSFYPLWLIDLLKQRGFLAQDENQLILTPVAMLFWQQPRTYQYAVLFQALLSQSCLSTAEGKALLQEMEALHNASDGKRALTDPKLYTILDAYGMSRLSADILPRAMKTPLLQRVLTYLDRKKSHQDNVCYLTFTKENR